MHNLCYTLRERADLYHFTPCLIAWAQFSVVPYSVFEINSKRRVWIHLSGCLILSLGSSRGCLKAWRRRKIKYSTSMTNKIPFVPKCCTFILKNKRKYHTSFQAQHFKSKRFSSSQGLLQGLASKMFYCELQCEQSLENIEANEIGLNCKFSLPTSRLCAICSWCCRPFFIRLWPPMCQFQSNIQNEGRKKGILLSSGELLVTSHCGGSESEWKRLFIAAEGEWYWGLFSLWRKTGSSK